MYKPRSLWSGAFFLLIYIHVSGYNKEEDVYNFVLIMLVLCKNTVIGGSNNSFRCVGSPPPYIEMLTNLSHVIVIFTLSG